MNEDSNRNRMNMIGAYLILYYDINDERTARPSQTLYNIKEKSKSDPSNTIFSRIHTYIFLVMNQIKQF